MAWFPETRLRPIRLGVLLLCAAVIAVAVDKPSAAAGDIRAWLQQKVTDEPDNGSAWRLYGKQLLTEGDAGAAFEALSRAIALTPDSAAAWCDFGRAAAATGDLSTADEAFETVLLLAPESDYAVTAREEQERLSAVRSAVASTSDDGGDLQTVGFEIRRFDGEDVLDQLDDTDPPRRRLLPGAVDLRMESGVLYNSNVALAPVSRQLAPGDRESFQVFAAPDIRWSVIDEPAWRSGPTFRGRFTFNEGQFRQFNLQSYRPGWFAEWYVCREGQLFVPRIAWDFTHDEFDGRTFGNRHGLLGSVSAFWNDDHASFLYVAADTTDFRNDGLLPSVTSQDGWLTSIGLSHDLLLTQRYCRLVRGGAELTQADTDGSDYRFRGVTLFVEGVFPITDSLELTLSGGWGYRDYYDYEFQPSRNEVLWRGGAELRKYLTPSFSVAALCDFNRFDSDNPLFAADRMIAGTVAEFEY